LVEGPKGLTISLLSGDHPRSRGARIACVLGRDRAVHAATSQVAHTTAGATTVTVEPTPITDREDLS
jgi:hypothetical protein